MCTILDAAEERGVNRGETLKLIMMVQKKIKKGDSIAKMRLFQVLCKHKKLI